MNTMTKNIRTHLAVIRGEKELRRLPITEEQYRTIAMAKSDGKATDLFILKNPDTGEVIFHGELRLFQEFEEIKSQKLKGTYVCMFGGRHDVSADCNCLKPTNLYGLEERLEKQRKWTINKRAELTEKDIDCFREVVEEKYGDAIKGGYIGPKLFDTYVDIEIRAFYNYQY